MPALVLVMVVFRYRFAIPWPFNQYVGDVAMGILVYSLIGVFYKGSNNMVLLISIVSYVPLTMVLRNIQQVMIIYYVHAGFDYRYYIGFAAGCAIASLVHDALEGKNDEKNPDPDADT